MRLTVLGCAGSFPGPASPSSSYLVESDGFRLLLDVGSGALGALQKHGDLLDVDAVLLSHLHADHFIDLVPYAVARRYHPGGPPPRLPVYGPTGTQRRLESAFGRRGLEDVYDFHTVRPGRLHIGPFDVTLERMAHPVACHAARFEADGRTLVYSADTGPTERLVRVAHGADLFLCEASWTERPGLPADLHLTGRQAGEHAARAGAGSLLLTHIVPWADAKRLLEEAGAEYAETLALAQCDESYRV